MSRKDDKGTSNPLPQAFRHHTCSRGVHHSNQPFKCCQHFSTFMVPWTLLQFRQYPICSDFCPYRLDNCDIAPSHMVHDPTMLHLKIRPSHETSTPPNSAPLSGYVICSATSLLGAALFILKGHQSLSTTASCPQYYGMTGLACDPTYLRGPSIFAGCKHATS